MGCISRKELNDIKDKFEWLKTFYEIEIEKKEIEIAMARKKPALVKEGQVETAERWKESFSRDLDEADRLRRRVWAVIKEMEEAKVEEICTLK